MPTSNWKALAVAVLGTEVIGSIGSIFSIRAIPEWYQGLAKSALNPPNWVFGPVWTTLYALMGIAAFFIWKRGWQNAAVKTALGVFILQLILNSLWSIIFFGLHAPFFALIDIAVLWIAIVVTIYLFARQSRVAAGLLIPYLLWVSFAFYLNYSIVRLN